MRRYIQLALLPNYEYMYILISQLPGKITIEHAYNERPEGNNQNLFAPSPIPLHPDRQSLKKPVEVQLSDVNPQYLPRQ